MVDMEALRPQVLPEKVAQDFIWHYTNAAGLEGILRSNTLWASAVQSLNDDQELLHGIDCIRAAAQQGPAKRPIRDWVERAAERLEDSVLLDSFVLSASLYGESMHQFEHYGPYALGFDPLMELSKQPVGKGGPATMAWGDPRFASGWRKVIYGIRCGVEHAETIVDALSTLENGCRDEDAIELVIRRAAYLKSDSWRPEQEVRLYGRPGPSKSSVRVRARGDEFVRYLAVTASSDASKTAKLPLRAIRLSPQLSAGRGVAVGVEALLRETGYAADVKVIHGAR